MKKMILSIVTIVAVVTMGCKPTKVANTTRDYAYEAYCDSIYEADPDYYLDVLCETDEFANY